MKTPGKESYRMIKELGGLLRHFLPRGKTTQEKLSANHYFVDLDVLRKAVERVAVEDHEMNRDNPLAARWCQMGRWLDESTSGFPAKQDLEQILELKHAVNVISHFIDRHKGNGPVAIEKPLIWDIYCRITFLHACEGFHGKNVKRWRNNGDIAYILPRGEEMRKHFEEARNYFDQQRDALRTRKASDKSIVFLTPPNEGIYAEFRLLSRKTDFQTPVVKVNADMGYVCDPASAIRHFSVIMIEYFKAHPEIEQDRIASLDQKAAWEARRNTPRDPVKPLSAEIL